MMQIHWMDEARRQVGRALDASGLGPQEVPYRVVAEWPGARLRAYHDQERADGPVLLIIPAPLNRAGFLGGVLAWITRLGAPPSDRNSAPRLRPAAGCRRARAARGGWSRPPHQ